MRAEKEVEVDNLGSRFVQMEGLEKPVFELETLPCRFLTKALENGAHLKVPRDEKGRCPTEEEWNRNAGMVILNYFGKVEGEGGLSSGFSHQQMGEEYSITRERVRQIVLETIKSLHTNCPDYLQQKYPLTELLGQIKRSGFMVDHRGTTRQIAEAVLTGASHQDLMKRGYSAQDLVFYRRILSDYHLKVPYDPRWNEDQQLINDLKALSADDPQDKKQQLLERITASFYKNNCLAVSGLAKETGLHFVRQKGEYNLILQALSEAGINWRVVLHEVKSGPQQGLSHYYFILAVDKKEAVSVLQNDPNLEPLRREKVRQVSFEKVDKLPTVWELIKGQEYSRVGSLVRQMRQRVGGRGFKMMQVLEGLEGCPVPILQYGTHYYYPINRGGQLEEFFKNKLGV